MHQSTWARSIYSCMGADAMLRWMWKEVNPAEAEEEFGDDNGWSTLGPTGSERIQSCCDAHTDPKQGFYVTISPMVSLKIWLLAVVSCGVICRRVFPSKWLIFKQKEPTKTIVMLVTMGRQWEYTVTMASGHVVGTFAMLPQSTWFSLLDKLMEPKAVKIHGGDRGDLKLVYGTSPVTSRDMSLEITLPLRGYDPWPELQQPERPPRVDPAHGKGRKTAKLFKKPAQHAKKPAKAGSSSRRGAVLKKPSKK